MRLGPIGLSYLAAFVLFVLVSLYSPGFASPSHIATLVIVAAFIGIVAIGQTMVIIGGGIDLSVPWFMNSAAMMVTGLAHGQNAPLVWVVPLILLAGCLAGAVNGVGIALLRVPPIVMTMSRHARLPAAPGAKGAAIHRRRQGRSAADHGGALASADHRCGLRRAPHRLRPLRLCRRLQPHRRHPVSLASATPIFSPRSPLSPSAAPRSLAAPGPISARSPGRWF
jgi:hypothetical protein